MPGESTQEKKRQGPKKITPQRLKNIALYYLKRFDSSIDNLRQVLRRRINTYAYYHPEWNKQEAFQWVEDILKDFEDYGYLNDARYTEMKVKNYLAAGKSQRYIITKLRQKGISEAMVSSLIDKQEYDPFETALHFAQKKKIGPFRVADNRSEFRQKDMGTLLRAGFDYDVVQQVLSFDA